MKKSYTVYTCNQLQCDSYTDPNFIVRPYFVIDLKNQGTGAENVDHLAASLPVQAFVYSKIFHSVFSQAVLKNRMFSALWETSHKRSLCEVQDVQFLK